jgi:TonB family protein
MAANINMGRFVMISAGMHAVAALLTAGVPSAQTAPEPEVIQVTFVGDTAPENADLPFGKITDLNEPPKNMEMPEKGEAIASFDARATSVKGRQAGQGAAETTGAERGPEAKLESPPAMESNLPQIKERREASPPMSGDAIDRFALANPGGTLETEDEIIIPFNTRKSEYLKYFQAIKDAVAGAWVYPEDAMKKGRGGKALVRFTINSKGELEEAKTILSAGAASLDDAAVEAVKISAPFEPFPAGLTKDRIHIVATFDYTPQYGAAH